VHVWTLPDEKPVARDKGENSMQTKHRERQSHVIHYAYGTFIKGAFRIELPMGYESMASHVEEMGGTVVQSGVV